MLLEFEDERLLEDVVVSQPILVLVRFLVFETNRMFLFPRSDVVLKARKRLGLKNDKSGFYEKRYGPMGLLIEMRGRI